jgi:hypothetical protein
LETVTNILQTDLKADLNSITNKFRKKREKKSKKKLLQKRRKRSLSSSFKSSLSNQNKFEGKESDPESLTNINYSDILIDLSNEEKLANIPTIKKPLNSFSKFKNLNPHKIFTFLNTKSIFNSEFKYLIDGCYKENQLDYLSDLFDELNNIKAGKIKSKYIFNQRSRK